jgi:hypothetical protein
VAGPPIRHRPRLGVAAEQQTHYMRKFPASPVAKCRFRQLQVLLTAPPPQGSDTSRTELTADARAAIEGCSGQNQRLDLRHRARPGVTSGFGKSGSVPSCSHAECWSLGAAVAGEAARRQRRIDFDKCRTPGGNVPTLKAPEMNRAEAISDEPQPRDAAVGGFRHRPLDVEMKDRFSHSRRAPG